jgi:hypothetical protein
MTFWLTQTLYSPLSKLSQLLYINRLPSGRDIYRVKTPEEFGAEVTAKKAKKAATKTKKEDNAAAKASAKAAKATAAQQPAGNLKRKRVAPVKTSKG